MSLQTIYQEQVKPKFTQELRIKNPMAIPRVEKVVVDMGVGEGAKNKELLEQLTKDLALITGQKPQLRRARIAVSGFGIRKNDPVGLRVTLRSGKMYAFLEKLFSVVLPRLRDFRGVKLSAFDKRGNYTLGLSEHTIFPEVDLAKSAKSWGLGITIVTTAQSDGHAKVLLETLGMPFEKNSKF